MILLKYVYPPPPHIIQQGANLYPNNQSLLKNNEDDLINYQRRNLNRIHYEDSFDEGDDDDVASVVQDCDAVLNYLYSRIHLWEN